MSAANDLARMVPGFEFLQSLMKGAGAALPGVQGFGQWVAPTLDPEELDKRIQELKTVQFWLEQNARLLGTTVQALEVQRMTLSTLQTMNLPMADLRDALKARLPSEAAAPAPAPPPAPAPAAAAAPEPAALETPESPPAAAAPAIDPMKWWGALTQQFADIASRAVQPEAAKGASAQARSQPGAQPRPKSAAKASSKPRARPASSATASKTVGKAVSKAAGNKAGKPAEPTRAASPRARKA